MLERICAGEGELQVQVKCRLRINFLDHGLMDMDISALEHVMKLILWSFILLLFINRICKHYYA